MTKYQIPSVQVQLLLFTYTILVALVNFQVLCSSFVFPESFTTTMPSTGDKSCPRSATCTEIARNKGSAFLPTTSKRTHPSLLFSSSSSNPIDDESEEEREKRMELVRQLQKSFYKDDIISISKPRRGSTIMKDVPLWRTQWTELPGFQNVLNVHVPHYTNMFQKILRSNASSVSEGDSSRESSSSEDNCKYFGHLYLEGGSENLDNPEYKLEEGSKSTLTGVLMKISAHKELEDGRLVLVVQALEKFKVLEAKRHHSPYSIATIEITPDKELVHAQKTEVIEYNDFEVDDFKIDEDENCNGNSCSATSNAVAEAFDWHDFEFQPVTDCVVSEINNGVSVSPLVNYNAKFIGSNKIEASKNIDDAILELEYKVWVLVDEMIHLLQSFVDPRKEKPIPIPTQVLGLLPVNPLRPWPEQFRLEKYADKLEQENALIGTFSKSEFVRVDNHITGYSPIRRAQRLSYTIWALTDTIILPDACGYDTSRQRMLEVNSVEKRLDAAVMKLQMITLMIRNVLNRN
mmetsp:Transcript_22330/g.33437  ORF Transcript_22330/g.33437 Transcript_22330/m.33437 type:complete len:518 (-) Transcript_22330:56-1609(-)|eukprot:CAMPEP_0203680038 /NCGR_PEP_ID=MMETSP0090-20130426/37811_1 /ASSEMBLY_ACC=CAM_ASM_001088 /TAXON_ID=426623 /ORGANISM="Chaetoceros affinis, Strain CCMP159" /LENGTH=517 /DNA_ID=CAMNT_0050547923 /DNA_START=154 /DNA_END=1707 /DNA_ORIENTATION=+